MKVLEWSASLASVTKSMIVAETWSRRRSNLEAKTTSRAAVRASSSTFSPLPFRLSAVMLRNQRRKLLEARNRTAAKLSGTQGKSHPTIIIIKGVLVKTGFLCVFRKTQGPKLKPFFSFMTTTQSTSTTFNLLHFLSQISSIFLESQQLSYQNSIHFWGKFNRVAQKLRVPDVIKY